MSANILIAEDNDISREMMMAILKTRGYNTVPAVDGRSAINAINTTNIDMALVDINMAPTGGFEFVEYLVSQGIDIPVVIVTADDSSDILMKASSLGVAQLIHKPLQPDRLLSTVQRILARRGLNAVPLATETRERNFSAQELMQKTIRMAYDNVLKGRGQPFAAIVADQDGKILGEGVNGNTSRVDPTAHAEVMAIRQAAEKLGQADLSECVLYCNSEPTMMGRALIISAGIKKVYFGLTHEEIRESLLTEEKVRKEIKHFTPSEAEYERLCHDEAMEMYKAALRSDDAN